VTIKDQTSYLRFNPPPLLTTGEASKFSGIDKVKIRRAISAGTLPHVEYEGRSFVRPAELIAFLGALAQLIAEAAR
jgi:Helix-turn-helix domain